jgi:hypothetical protein
MSLASRCFATSHKRTIPISPERQLSSDLTMLNNPKPPLIPSCGPSFDQIKLVIHGLKSSVESSQCGTGPLASISEQLLLNVYTTSRSSDRLGGERSNFGGILTPDDARAGIEIISGEPIEIRRVGRVGGEWVLVGLPRDRILITGDIVADGTFDRRYHQAMERRAALRCVWDPHSTFEGTTRRT